MIKCLIAGLLFLASVSFCDDKPVISVGSKVFTEGYIVSEIISQVIERTNEAKVNRRFGLGGTGIVYEALRTNAIDIYPEYTGTIAEEILKNPNLKNNEEIKAALQKRNFAISNELGFNNTYAVAIRRDIAEKLGIKKLSDLRGHPELNGGFSHEFLNRADGYERLSRFYNFRFLKMRGLQHGLAFEALANKEIDLIDIYSTDAKIEKFNVVVLEDDKKFFPRYAAVILAGTDFELKYPKTWAALQNLKSKINEKEMTHLNALVEINGYTFSEAASQFLSTTGFEKPAESLASKILHYTLQHLSLVFISLIAATLVGIPLGILAARSPVLGQFVITISGVVQTIPSLALLCFLIPFFGIGIKPSLVALFLYGLLPIVTNTHIGLKNIDPHMIEMSEALGFKPFQRLRIIELPLASPSILAGIKTSTIINIGTATIAALIGAGGYGVPIVTGLSLNNNSMILQGAIPAACLALFAQGFFEGLALIIIPKGLRLSRKSFSANSVN